MSGKLERLFKQLTGTKASDWEPPLTGVLLEAEVHRLQNEKKRGTKPFGPPNFTYAAEVEPDIDGEQIVLVSREFDGRKEQARLFCAKDEFKDATSAARQVDRNDWMPLMD